MAGKWGISNLQHKNFSLILDDTDKPRLSFQRLRKVRVGTSGISSSRRATASSSRGVERGTMFHEEGVGSGNENESRAGSSYGIRNLLSHLNPSTESAGGTLSERLEKSFTKEELRDYQQMFEMFDTDGSGALGNEELKEAIISIGLQANDSEIDEIIREVDEDGNGEIDFEEFCHCMKKSQNLVTRASNEEIARQCFEVFDQDGNGLITENEFVYVAKEVGGFSQELAEFVFHELDISSNGHLSADQFSAIVEDYLLSDNKSET
ncbi:EF hand domain-containing protein [Ditylenchus destructor]|nr:EF hand domain-containing protein [Ditylenchus destructor]